MTNIDKRPWGEYEVLLDENNVKVKKITVQPGGRLSYQYHNKRSEVWTIIEGTGLLTKDGATEIISPGNILTIPQGCKHRIENTGSQFITFIEVQMGSYFGEDDIIRIEDDYGRTN